MLEVSIPVDTALRGRPRMNAADTEAAIDYSNRAGADRGVGRAGAGLAAVGLAGAILAVVATFTDVIEIHVLTVTPKVLTGYDRSSVSLVLLGVFGALMALGAARGARPAMWALAAAGLVVLLISVVHDLPHLNDAGVWNQAGDFEDAQATAGPGYYLETASGILMLGAGTLLLLLSGGLRRRSV